MVKLTLDEVLSLREKEDRVEFKQARNSYSFEGGGKTDYKKRRKCILGYVVALANEGGGYLIFGVEENTPKHTVVGTKVSEGDEGKLSQRIYERLQIRVEVYPLYDDSNNRVLVIDVPSRPIGRVLTYEDVALMRVGDELRRMDDAQYHKIISEQEPDFSAKICQSATIADLDKSAIGLMKSAYADKQNNESFRSIEDEQALSDLDLLIDGQLTYAALILLGKAESLKELLPQAMIRMEIRNKAGQIVFDKREDYLGGYFSTIEEIWKSIDLRNGSVPVQKDSFILDIPFFNYEVIREAINNAVAHRDYKLTSEIVIKLYNSSFNIYSPGGFPKGVTLENLITVSSTPRNRLLADVLSKTGAVERSGQGVDKIFFQSISEAKGAPDYSRSDNYQVELQLSGIVQDKAFALFIKEIQKTLPEEDRLSVQEVITLDKIRRGESKKDLDSGIRDKLLGLGFIEKVGRTNSQRLKLSKTYYEFADKKVQYTEEQPLDYAEAGILIQRYLSTFETAKMKEFAQLLKRFYTKSQVKYLVYKLVEIGLLESNGKGSGTYYTMGSIATNSQKFLQRALNLGIEQMRKNGEIEPNSPPEDVF